jgi:subtilisin family serine protease
MLLPTNNSSSVNVDVQSDMPTACSSDYLIAVTNSDNNDHRVAAYGPTTIDLSAPGTNILSTVPPSTVGIKTGTSMASPHVAGAVALICSLPCSGLSNDLKNDPAGSALRLKNFILEGVDPITSMEGQTVTGGRLNVYQALLNAAAYYNCNVGVDEVNPADETLHVYPNPADDVLNVEIKNLNTNSTLLTVKNVLGQTVLTKAVPPSLSNLVLNVSALPKGIYFLALENASFRNALSWIKD